MSVRPGPGPDCQELVTLPELSMARTLSALNVTNLNSQKVRSNVSCSEIPSALSMETTR
jgi:hypothetical protein